MLHNLYLIVAVALRVAGLLVAIGGISFAVLLVPLALMDPGRIMSAPLIAIFASLLGASLWFFSKPVARAVTYQL